MAGGIPANASWGRASLSLCNQSALNFPHLIERSEHIGIEHFRPVRPVEPLDEGILRAQGQ